MEPSAIQQEVDGDWRHLRGAAEIRTNDSYIRADEIDWNEQTGEAKARGGVYYKNYQRGEELWADHIEYNLKSETGTFYQVRGNSRVKFDIRPGLLKTDNPMYFQAVWAEKLKDRYILHNGTLTNCGPLSPWWTLRGPKFDVIPEDRAIVYRGILRIKSVPVLYAPVFYKGLKQRERRSGFLTPTIGNSSRRGQMVGVGYYWAINRSFDASYLPQYFSQRGFAHTAEFRGKPTQGSEFNAFVYGVNDRGELMDDGTRNKQGGYLLSISGQSQLPDGWFARGDFNYLSSFKFRQAFTESFTETVSSEVTSVGWLQKQWGYNGLYFVASRFENFQSTDDDDKITIRKLPQVEWLTNDHRLFPKGPPVYIGWEVRGGFLQRTQPLYQTRQYVQRVDLYPHVLMPLRWKGITLTPEFAVRETAYGSSFDDGDVVSRNLTRTSREFDAELTLPALERVYNWSNPFFGQRFKHVIEPRAKFRYVTGVNQFNNTIRFDETDLWSNTNQLEVSLTNRLYGKAKNGEVKEVLSWDVKQYRYFDPIFGGAVVAGRRNVVESSLDGSAFAFLDGPRGYSPVISELRANPFGRVSAEWRADYDPKRGLFVNNTVSGDVRFDQFNVNLGYSKIRCVPVRLLNGDIDPCSETKPPGDSVLSPPSNQFRGRLVMGDENRRGWNAAFEALYDFRTSVMQFANSQMTYNTECCAFSFQFRRFGFGIRNENQFRFSLVIANIGAFGTLKRQERLF